MSRAKNHTFILGGARSGKSSFAERVVSGLSSTRIYIATAQVWDDEMRARVCEHKARRDDGWSTIEAPLELVSAIAHHSRPDIPILVDCLTLWLTNLMLSERNIDEEGDRLVSILPDLDGSVTFVSNEVGQGIVPDNKMARDFRDHAGVLHQKISKAVDEVYFVTAGLPSKLKG